MTKEPNADVHLLQAAADPIRLRILGQLAQLGSACACDIAATYSVSQPTVSHHLRVLRQAGWITGERRGTWIWYSLVPGAVNRLRDIAASLDGFGDQPPRLPRLRVIQPNA
jgi:ArsR family transcriptional regulator